MLPPQTKLLSLPWVQWMPFTLMMVFNFNTQTLFAQVPISTICNGSTGVCTGSIYTFPAGVNSGTAQTGPAYGCLTTRPNPAWFFMQIQNSGTITFTMSSNPAKDIDFILWGPFTSPSTPCSAGLTAAKIVSCSYSTASTETATIPSGVSGDIYIILITNYSNQATNITFSQTGGSGTGNCDILCNVTGLTANVGGCGSGAQLGSFGVTGTITTFTPPATGTLTVASSCGGSQTFNAPFSTSYNYTLPNSAGNGNACTITASYSAVGTCTKSIAIASPTCCAVTAGSSVSVCEGQPLQLSASGTSGGSYVWSGPGGFSSSQQSPLIPVSSASNQGTYSVYLISGACTTPTQNLSVTIKTKPGGKQIVHE